MNIFAKKAGFTLVELIIYTALVSIILTFTTLFVVQISTGIVTTQFQESDQAQMVFVMNRLTQEIQNAAGVDVAQSTFGSSASSLALRNATGGIDIIQIIQPQGLLRILRSDGTSEALTTGDTPISSFIIDNESQARRPGVLHIRITPSHTNVPFEMAISFRKPIQLL